MSSACCRTKLAHPSVTNTFTSLTTHYIEVVTNVHSVPQGYELCARGINGGKADSVRLYGLIPTCPGCLAKAKSHIAYHLQQKSRASVSA